MSAPHWRWQTDFPFRFLAEPIQTRLPGALTNWLCRPAYSSEPTVRAVPALQDSPPVLVMLGCVRVPSPTFVEHSKPRRPQHPMLGRFLDAAQQKPLHGTGWCSQCRDWEASRTSNLAVWRRAVWSTGDRLETLAILEYEDGGGARTLRPGKLQASLKCRSCKKGRYALRRSHDRPSISTSSSSAISTYSSTIRS